MKVEQITREKGGFFAKFKCDRCGTVMTSGWCENEGEAQSRLFRAAKAMSWVVRADHVMCWECAKEMGGKLPKFILTRLLHTPTNETFAAYIRADSITAWIPERGIVHHSHGQVDRVCEEDREQFSKDLAAYRS